MGTDSSSGQEVGYRPLMECFYLRKHQGGILISAGGFVPKVGHYRDLGL